MAVVTALRHHLIKVQNGDEFGGIIVNFLLNRLLVMLFGLLAEFM